LVPKKIQWAWLLALSYYFYLSWKPAYGWVIFLTTIVTYTAAFSIERLAQKKKNAHAKKAIFITALVCNTAILFVFKYLNFFDFTLNNFFGFSHIPIVLPQFSLLLPIGISFYIFSSIAYLVDVYKQKIPAEKHLGIFALFVLFFPKLIAGPIERGKDLLPQLHKGKDFNYQQTVSGLQLFTFGLFKKAVVADNLGLIVDHIFLSLHDYKGLSLILTIIFFSWQIYADFSGYTDMARGVARILGFQLTENFARPYAATSVGEFWRRWHISLSNWIKEYIYIPLGGNRKGALRSYFNVMIAFIICGIWHGAAWNFILWGAFHGACICFERMGNFFLKGKVEIPKIFSHIYLYGVVCVSWIFFRAKSFAEIIYIVRNAPVGLKNFFLPQYIFATLSRMFTTNMFEMSVVLFGVTFMIVLEILPNKKIIAQKLTTLPIALRFAFYTAVAVMIILLRNVQITQFIYVQF
jgi:D-alanyl-lipoteichoic acid acyltransferase DltB (MBOAT superfamily)